MADKIVSSCNVKPSYSLRSSGIFHLSCPYVHREKGLVISTTQLRSRTVGLNQPTYSWIDEICDQRNEIVVVVSVRYCINRDCSTCLRLRGGRGGKG